MRKSIILVLISALIIAMILLLLRFFMRQEKLIELKIKAPSNCEYKIHIRDNKFIVSSASISYETNEYKTVFADTVILKYDTLMSDYTSKVVSDLVDDIEPEIKSLSGGDTYVFELLLDGQLMKRKTGYDKKIYQLIKEVRPYIIESRIQCCDFFVLFDSVAI